MTKLRPPLSFERALCRIADVLGWPAMGAMVDRSGRTVQEWSDHTLPKRITLHQAFLFEQAYVEAGGDGYPFSDCWRLRLGVSEGGDADPGALAALFARACKEGGEAASAVAHLLSPGAHAGDRSRGRREVAEQIDALTQLLAHLDAEGAVPEGGGPEESPRGGEQT